MKAMAPYEKEQITSLKLAQVRPPRLIVVQKLQTKQFTFVNGEPIPLLVIITHWMTHRYLLQSPLTLSAWTIFISTNIL